MPQQARAVAIMPNDLDQATAAAPKNVEITSVRIPLQTLLSQMRKAREHMTTEHPVVRSGKLKKKAVQMKVLRRENAGRSSWIAFHHNTATAAVVDTTIEIKADTAFSQPCRQSARSRLSESGSKAPLSIYP